MWWSRARIGLIAVALLAAPLLSACSGLSPVYRTDGVATDPLPLVYAKPNNRLEQIIYEDLALRLGKAEAGSGPTLKLDVSQSSRDLTNNTITAPNTQEQMVVTARIELTDVNGKKVFSGSRSASADYTANSQSFATREAADDAARRAARTLADTIRLTILGALAR